jgi:hypothetical protein
MAQISFEVSARDSDLIRKIVNRVQAEYQVMLAQADGPATAKRIRQLNNRMDITMDITACHANGNPLDLEKLLAADDFNFMHDVFGIRDHLDRDDRSPTGGQLLHFFSPRCSQREAA